MGRREANGEEVGRPVVGSSHVPHERPSGDGVVDTPLLGLLDPGVIELAVAGIVDLTDGVRAVPRVTEVARKGHRVRCRRPPLVGVAEDPGGFGTESGEDARA